MGVLATKLKVLGSNVSTKGRRKMSQKVKRILGLSKMIANSFISDLLMSCYLWLPK